ncbi:MAG: NAD(P)-dependent alcohol dehydrogenase [Verrucomicrobia bacterium]|nr:NAD(P)-dependent alcohol dehydrogenase [Verrucomicrobiota bacterium]
MKTHGYGALNADSPLKPFSFERRSVGPHDVHIEILYCGICHSDIHTARNEWHDTIYPAVLGHEILGVVKQVGREVKRFHPGDHVMVGCLVDSCRTCPSCKQGLEQYCEGGFTLTYNSPDPHMKGKPTYGGYSKQIVVDEKFTFQVPKKFKKEQFASLAPLVCAGITTYSPLRHWKVGKGSRVGIVGLGGLGHMAIKLAHAMGAEVTLLTTSPGKMKDGKKLGADHAVLSTEQGAMEKLGGTFDFILNTVAASHNLEPFFQLLKRDGTMCLVGLPDVPHPPLPVWELTLKRRQLSGSFIGGIAETQEMLNFCAEHNVTSDIELVSIDQINEAYERMLKNDVKYRFVIDMSSLN